MSIDNLSRLALVIAHAAIITLAVIHSRQHPHSRGYTVPVAALAFVNFAFYALAYAWRIGQFSPPTSDFFSTLSNVRSWGTAVTVLVILAAEVRD